MGGIRVKYSNEELKNMYYHLVNARVFVEKMHESVFSGNIRTSFHSPLGQEALSVGVACALDKNDWIAPSHRFQPASIMRFDMYKFIAELFAKEDGLHLGVAFDLHCNDFGEGRMLPPIGTLGSTYPAYTGFAWALKRSGKKEIVAIVQGDGGCSEGVVYESWNIASLYKAPVVFIIENNEWAMTVPLDRQTSNYNIAERAAPFGLPYRIVDGNDIIAVREGMEMAADLARNGQPNVIEFKTLRWDAHFVGQGDDYRHDKEKIEFAKKFNDPVKKFEDYLLNNGVITPEYVESLRKERISVIDGYVEKAKNSPIAKKEDIFKMEYIYSNTVSGGKL